VNAATAGLVGAFGATTLTGGIAYLTERSRRRAARRDKGTERKRDVYARFLWAVNEMTRTTPEDEWKALRDEVGRLQFEIMLIAPQVSEHAEALAHDASTNMAHDRQHGVVHFKGGLAWDKHWEPLVEVMRKDLKP
jgi:hypothetical protein